MMTDKPNLDDHLTRAWNARWNQDQVLWRIFGAFWPTNAILLAALFRTGGNVVPRRLAIVTCFVGLFVACIWWLIQRRAIINIVRLEKTAKKLEKEVLGCKVTQYALSPELNTQDTRAADPWPGARQVIPACIIIVALAWLIGLILSLFVVS